MKNVFIRTDGTPEMNKKCLDHLISLGCRINDSICSTQWAYDRFVSNSSISYFRTCRDGFITWTNGEEKPSDYGYTEIFLPDTTNKHPHYDLIVKWVADTSQKVWCSYEGVVWKLADKPLWCTNKQYHLGDLPPVDLEPVTDLVVGKKYYIAVPSSIWYYSESWNIRSPNDNHLLDKKLVYSTKEGAINRAKEMLGMD